MKKLLSTLLVLLTITQTAFALPSDTKSWTFDPQQITVSASEMILDSDLKNDFKIYQTTITNISDKTIEINILANENINDQMNKILNSGLTIKELMAVPKEIAVESYKEDVGSGNIAKAHKGLIYVLASAGAVVTGVGMLGTYPSQKTSEYFTNRKIKKEFAKFSNNVSDTITLSPKDSREVYILIAPNSDTCIINTKSVEESSL